jgi:hypothetical protein
VCTQSATPRQQSESDIDPFFYPITIHHPSTALLDQSPVDRHCDDITRDEQRCDDALASSLFVSWTVRANDSTCSCLSFDSGCQLPWTHPRLSWRLARHASRSLTLLLTSALRWTGGLSHGSVRPVVLLSRRSLAESRPSVLRRLDAGPGSQRSWGAQRTTRQQARRTDESRLRAHAWESLPVLPVLPSSALDCSWLHARSCWSLRRFRALLASRRTLDWTGRAGRRGVSAQARPQQTDEASSQIRRVECAGSLSSASGTGSLAAVEPSSSIQAAMASRVARPAWVRQPVSPSVVAVPTPLPVLPCNQAAAERGAQGTAGARSELASRSVHSDAHSFD